jgi:hypothetical protein
MNIYPVLLLVCIFEMGLGAAMLGYFCGWQGRDHTWCPEAGFARTYTAFRDFNSGWMKIALTV